MDIRPAPLLRNRHLQSVLASSSSRRRRLLKAHNPLIAASRPCLIETPHARLSGSYSPQAGDTRGMVVLVHGWEGCVDSVYVLSMASRLYSAGFDVFRLNLRDHGGTHHLNEGMFHACRIEEVVESLATIHQRYRPEAPLLLGGFSLGGNIVLRAATAAPAAGLALSHVFAVCPVIDPRSALHNLEHGPFMYSHYFRRKWRASLRAKQASFPHIYNFDPVRRERSFLRLTDYFVKRYTDFSDAWAYLDGYAITGDRLAGLEVPATLVASRDDPILPISDLERMARPPSLELMITRHGGHCGFVADWRGRVWIEPLITRRLLRAARHQRFPK